MWRLTGFITLACVLLYAHFGSTEFSAPDFEKCHFDDSACFTKVTNYLLTKYAKTGVRSLNVIPIDPLHVKSIKLDPNPKSAINVAFHFKDVDIYGLGDVQKLVVSGFTHDASNPIVLSAFVPHVAIKGPYSVDGTMLGLPIHGKGDCEIALDNIMMAVKVTTKLVKGDDEYLSIEKATLEMSKPDKVNFRFDGLFGGDMVLSDSVHELLNQNWSDIFGTLRPGMTDAFALICKEILKQAFSKYPYREFFKTD